MEYLPEYDPTMHRLDFDIFKEFNPRFNTYNNELNQIITDSIKIVVFKYTILFEVLRKENKLNIVNIIIFLELLKRYPFDLSYLNPNQIIVEAILDKILCFINEDFSINIDKLIKNVYYELSLPLLKKM